MHIEKVTRIVPAISPSRSHAATDNMRLVPLSLPRVKWLEKDPEFAAKYVDEGSLNQWKGTGKNPAPGKIDADYLTKDPSVVYMTKSERRVFDMRVNNAMTYEAISRELRIGNTTARNYFAVAVSKLKKYYDNLESQEG